MCPQSKCGNKKIQRFLRTDMSYKFLFFMFFLIFNAGEDFSLRCKDFSLCQEKEKP